jgi:UDP-2-acetamido-2-deoxy-ribo-hexuluronate aminotransferase
MTQRIEFVDLKAQYAAIRAAVDARIQRVLEHGQFILGPEVGELERKLASYIGVRECVTAASGTEALLIALMALGVKNGDEVITTTFTFAASAEVIVLLGAAPVFVDIEPDTYNIDPERIEAAITEKTRAIMPVSLFGQPPDMEAINAIAARHGGIPVIEDAAQSFGAVYRGRKSCGLSAIGCTSFFPSKPLGCYGDGGAIFTEDTALATAMREIRHHGQERRYYHTRIGVGGRLDTIQCAVLLAKLDRFDWEIAQRAAAAEFYLRLFGGSELVTSPVVRSDRSSVWAQFTIELEDRDAVAAELQAQGIPTAIHYPAPLHFQPAYKDVCRISGSLLNAENAASRVLSLPLHPYIAPATQERIAEAVLAAAGETRRYAAAIQKTRRAGALSGRH